ncbi:MAG: class I SAM-dependent methyltransferase [Bacteroidetes bacterium]|nr:class I SAM-dependent methyltransferase [Bacteroidota bacterium]
MILEFSRPSAFPFKQLYNFYFSIILPAIGRLVSGDARAYTFIRIGKSISEGEKVYSFFKTAGFKKLHLKKKT